MIARCRCAAVELEAAGTPIASAVCYCDTCQEGSRRLEALPNADPVRDADGGTAYVLYRTDRVRYTRGADLVRELKLAESGATRRSFASCCNTAMLMRFDDARHWVSVYRSRFAGDPEPLQFRICTKYKPDGVDVPNDVPSFAMYPPALMIKLLTAKLAMLMRPHGSTRGLAIRDDV